MSAVFCIVRGPCKLSDALELDLQVRFGSRRHVSPDGGIGRLISGTTGLGGMQLSSQTEEVLSFAVSCAVSAISYLAPE